MGDVGDDILDKNRIFPSMVDSTVLKIPVNPSIFDICRSTIFLSQVIIMVYVELAFDREALVYWIL